MKPVSVLFEQVIDETQDYAYAMSYILINSMTLFLVSQIENSFQKVRNLRT